MTIDLSYCDIHGNNLDTQETANSYVINKPGEYCLPFVYGCGIKDGKDNRPSYTVQTIRFPEDIKKIYTPGQFLDYKNKIIQGPEIKKKISGAKIISWDSSRELIKNIYTKNDYLYFSVPCIPETGANYVIGILDNSSRVVWSWHIWLWKDELKDIQATSYISFLNINLGSKIVNKKLTSWLYQWGRKDPIYPKELEKRYLHYDSPVTIGQAIQNPDIMFGSSTYLDDWFIEDGCNYWNSKYFREIVTKTIYDPCPRGYTVPEGEAFLWITPCHIVFHMLPPKDRFPMILDINDNIYTIARNSNDVVGIEFIMGGIRYSFQNNPPAYVSYQRGFESDIGIYLTSVKEECDFSSTSVSSFVMSYENSEGFINSHFYTYGSTAGYIRPQKERA